MADEEHVSRTRRLAASYRRWNRVHYLSGLIAALWFVLMAATGVLINHQEELGLVDMQVENGYLPAHYTDEFRPEFNAMNVVVADLHSGRFFGRFGRWLGDLVALALVVSVGSGGYCYWVRRRMGAG